jgi:hypothetical protein
MKPVAVENTCTAGRQGAWSVRRPANEQEQEKKAKDSPTHQNLYVLLHKGSLEGSFLLVGNNHNQRLDRRVAGVFGQGGEQEGQPEKRNVKRKSTGVLVSVM